MPSAPADPANHKTAPETAKRSQGLFCFSLPVSPRQSRIQILLHGLLVIGHYQQQSLPPDVDQGALQLGDLSGPVVHIGVDLALDVVLQGALGCFRLVPRGEYQRCV